MAPKVKAVLGVMSEAVETMCGWAFCVVAAYSLLFLNLTGKGCLWDSMRGVLHDTTLASPVRSSGPIVMRVVPPRPAELAEKAQNRMLAIPDVADSQITVPVSLAPQAAPAPAPISAAPAPAQAKTGKDWRPHLASKLKTFTVYGRGDQRASAGASVRGAASPLKSGASSATVASAPTPAKQGSAYQVGALTGEARPGISDHISTEESSAGEGSRNFR